MRTHRQTAHIEPDIKSDDKEFDVTAPITDNHTVYAEITIVPVATNLDLSIDENSNIIKTSDREYYIQPGTKFKMNATPSRDDGHFDEIKDNPEYTKYKNDITWYTSNADVASVDPKTGEVTMHKTGKAEISARMYENTPKYQRHSVLSSPLRVSNLEKEVNRDGIIINTQVGLKAEKGRFEELSGTEKAVRFIGYINEDFFPYITAAQFKVEAINDEGRVQKTFEYTATSFSRKITYYSKTPSQAYFKPWEQAGKVGTAFTITRLPDQEFIGQFKATFIVTDGVSEISVPCQSSVNYRGV